MQLAIGALAKIFGGGAPMNLIPGAAAGAAKGSGALSVLQGVSTTLKVLAGIGAANAAAESSLDQASEAELQAGQEKLKGAQRQTAMTRELARVLGENDVTFASAGIDISSGIAQSARQTAKKRAASEISIDRADSDFMSALFRLRAQNLRARAKTQRGGGLIGALGDVANFGIDLAGRG